MAEDLKGMTMLKKTVLQVGSYPAELLAACAAEGVEPGALLDWAVTAREVRLILPSGAKVKHPLCGAWAQPKPPAEKSQPEPAKPAKGQK